MSHINTVLGFDLTELLTNEAIKIDDNDEDLKKILKSFGQLPDSSEIEMKERTVAEPTMKAKLRKDGRRSITYSSSLSYMHLKLQSPDIYRMIGGKGRRGGYRNRFPTKLFKLLEESEASGHSHIISWLPHGRAFKMHDEDLFVQHVLNKYFKSSLESFKRQLYMYGFKKIGTRFPDCGAYFHIHFIRHEQDLCSTIRNWKSATEYKVEDVNFREVPMVLQNVNKCLVRDS